jgi:hypothetical protein
VVQSVRGSAIKRQRAFASIARFNRSRQIAAAGPYDQFAEPSANGRYLRIPAGWSRRTPDIQRSRRWTSQSGGKRPFAVRVMKGVISSVRKKERPPNDPAAMSAVHPPFVLQYPTKPRPTNQAASWPRSKASGTFSQREVSSLLASADGARSMEPSGRGPIASSWPLSWQRDEASPANGRP